MQDSFFVGCLLLAVDLCRPLTTAYRLRIPFIRLVTAVLSVA
jgi:hypothetical protein